MRSLILLALPLLALSFSLERRSLMCDSKPCTLNAVCSATTQSSKLCTTGGCCDCQDSAATTPPASDPCPSGYNCGLEGSGGGKAWRCHKDCVPAEKSTCTTTNLGTFNDATCKCTCATGAKAACDLKDGSLDKDCTCVCSTADRMACTGKGTFHEDTCLCACSGSCSSDFKAFDKNCNCACTDAVKTACKNKGGILNPDTCLCSCDLVAAAACSTNGGTPTGPPSAGNCGCTCPTTPVCSGTFDKNCKCVPNTPPPPTCDDCSHGAKCVSGKCKCLTTHYGIKKDSCKKGYHCVTSKGKQSCKKNAVKKQVSYSKNSGFNW